MFTLLETAPQLFTSNTDALSNDIVCLPSHRTGAVITAIELPALPRNTLTTVQCHGGKEKRIYYNFLYNKSERLTFFFLPRINLREDDLRRPPLVKNKINKAWL